MVDTDADALIEKWNRRTSDDWGQEFEMKTEFVYHNHALKFANDVNDFGRMYVKSFVPYGFEDDCGNADKMMDTRHTNGFVRFRIFYESTMELLRIEAETISLSLEPSNDVELVDYCDSLIAWLRGRQ